MEQPTNLQQEHIGLAKVHEICARMNSIWRPTLSADIGIDGQIEFLESGSIISTGKIIAVQVKSGQSYFANQDEHYVRYYPTDAHRRYWQRLQLPVLLALHDTKSGLTYYARAKPQLERGGPILVSKKNLLSQASRLDLLQGHDEDQSLLNRQFDPERLLLAFRDISVAVGGQTEFTGIHFLLACCNLEQRFFELRQTRLSELIEALVTDSAIHFGSGYYEFLHRCVLKCWANRLTEPFEEEFEKSWYDLQMVPDILVSLTERGINLVCHLLRHAEVYISIEAARSRGVATAEAFAGGLMALAQAASDQLDRSDRLGEGPR